jgi:hypothetical protein
VIFIEEKEVSRLDLELPINLLDFSFLEIEFSKVEILKK